MNDRPGLGTQPCYEAHDDLGQNYTWALKSALDWKIPISTPTAENQKMNPEF